MSRFLGGTARSITPYVPGEQPQDKRYIKLNTNECPYPPSPGVLKALRELDYGDLRLYPDPDSRLLREAMAKSYGLAPEQVFAAGGSDEVLAYGFMAFFSSGDKVVFPDVTYGFYKVYADLFDLQAEEVLLREDFTVNLGDYKNTTGHIFLANPNAPTGICLEPEEIEALLISNPDRLVVVDEAYIDFAGGRSCVPLVGRYDNLLVVQTFSKSRSLAGMRLGFAFGNPALIAGLERIKYSFNPYNIDHVSAAVGMAAIIDEEYLRSTVERVTATRERTSQALSGLGFQVLPSKANFLFAAAPNMDGRTLYEKLKERGVLVRVFPKGRTAPFARITVGSDEEMDVLLNILKDLID